MDPSETAEDGTMKALTSGDSTKMLMPCIWIKLSSIGPRKVLKPKTITYKTPSRERMHLVRASFNSLYPTSCSAMDLSDLPHQ